MTIDFYLQSHAAPHICGHNDTTVSDDCADILTTATSKNSLLCEGRQTHGASQCVAYLHLPPCQVQSTTHLHCMAVSFREHSVAYCA